MIRSFIYLIIALACIFYALPLIPFYNQDSLVTLFSAVWVGFALIIIGAHLNNIIDIDFKRKIELIKLEKYRLWKKEQKLLQSQSKGLRRME
ncbi:MAG: hypothetical protein AB7V16_04390 [Vulcanibacillus sp.]